MSCATAPGTGCRTRSAGYQNSPQEHPAFSRVDRGAFSSPALPAPRALVVRQAVHAEQVLQDSLALVLRVDRAAPADSALPAPRALVVRQAVHAEQVLQDSLALVLRVGRAVFLSPALPALRALVVRQASQAERAADQAWRPPRDGLPLFPLRDF